MNKRNLKRFSEQSYNAELTNLNSEAKKYKRMLELIKAIVPKASNVKELDKALNKKTGFDNSRMSAMAFSKELIYDEIHTLSKEIKDLDTTRLTNDYRLNDEYLKELRIKHTEYWSEEDAKAMELLNDIISKYNDLSQKHRKYIGYDFGYKLVFNPMIKRM